MRISAIALLIIFAACAGHAGQSSRLVVEYADAGVTISVTIPCDWAQVILLKNVPAVVVWGHGPDPKSAAEALWRKDGLRNDEWTQTIFLPADRRIPRCINRGGGYNDADAT